MSRLDEECIMAVVRNRSGLDSGEIDYSLMCDKFDRMSIGCLQDALKTLSVLQNKCTERIAELQTKETHNARIRFLPGSVLAGPGPVLLPVSENRRGRARRRADCPLGNARTPSHDL